MRIVSHGRIDIYRVASIVYILLIIRSIIHATITEENWEAALLGISFMKNNPYFA